MLQALPWTLALVGVTTILAFVLGTLIGLVAAWRRGGMLDSVLPPIFVITSAFPYFWLAMLAIWLFSIKLHWLPQSGGYDFTDDRRAGRGRSSATRCKHSILPALTILVTSIGGWILTMRNNMISVLTEDYVRMARAKGLSPWRVMWTYAGRNAILPNLTGFAMSLGFVVSGAILVEFVFNYPGVGWMFLQSVENQDYALMQGLFLMIVLAVLTGDPRRRRRDGAARPANAGPEMSTSSLGATDQLATPPVGPAPLVAELGGGRWARRLARDQPQQEGARRCAPAARLRGARGLPGPDRARRSRPRRSTAGARAFLAPPARARPRSRRGHLLSAHLGHAALARDRARRRRPRHGALGARSASPPPTSAGSPTGSSR